MPCRSSPKRLLAPVIGSPSSLTASSLFDQGRRVCPLGSRRIIHERTCQSSLSACALLARCVGELNERSARRLRGQDRAWDRGCKIEPRGFAVTPHIDPFRIDPGHPPTRAGATEQTARIVRNSVAVVFVHMSQNLELGRRERTGVEL